MTRKRLSTIVGVVGFVTACATLMFLLVAGSVFADARTENITGPGVDLFLRTPFPGEGGTVVIDVEARGGSRAGVSTIEVRHAGKLIGEATGKGATWGKWIRSGKSRGSDTETVRFVVPRDVAAGATMPLSIDVAYVVAVSSDGSFTNDSKRSTIPLDVAVYSSSGRLVAQLARVLLAVSCFFAWL